MSALKPGHLVSLLRRRLDAAGPEHTETTLGIAGPSGMYDVIDVRYSPERNEIWLEIDRRAVDRPPTGRRKRGP
jgi:hypothetical protein